MKKPTLFNVVEDAKTEIVEERVVDEKLGTKQMDVKVLWGRSAPYINVNDRSYRPELLQREIGKINERIAKGDTVWGASYHPADGLGKAGDVSHKWKKVWMEEDGTCKGTLTLLSTPEGMIVQELVKEGRLGISSRGFGTVTERKKEVNGMTVKYNDVNDDFRLVNPGDFVISPSVEGAGNIAEEVNQLESDLNKDLDLNLKEKKSDEMKKINEEFIQNMMKTMYADARRSSRHDNSIGTTQTFEEWKRDGGEKIVRATVAFENGEYGSVAEALAEMAPEVAEKLVIEQQLVTPAECYTEARIAGIDPVKMAEIINKSITEKEQAISTNWSKEERQKIYREAEQAGVDISTAEGRKKALDEYKTFESDEENLFEAEVVARHKYLAETGEEIPIEDVRKVMLREREEKKKEAEEQARIQSTVRESILAGPKRKF